MKINLVLLTVYCYSIIVINVILQVYAKSGSRVCNTTITTASGHSMRNTETICSGDLIFEDNFDTFDLKKWNHQIITYDNGEFECYVNNRSNSFAKDGILHIRPTLITEVNGIDSCTNSNTQKKVFRPVRSARIRTIDSFSFKYGVVDIRARLPLGDWLWPAIWLLPKWEGYGSWPASGEIDIMESRGNEIFIQDGKNIGVERFGSTLNYGPYRGLNGWRSSSFDIFSKPGQGFHLDFHNYQMEWTPEEFIFRFNNQVIGTIPAGKGMFDRGKFPAGVNNPWKYGSKLAPYDQEFFILINMAIGGITYFPDNAKNPDGKPWKNVAGHAAEDFWAARDKWLATWNYYDTESNSCAFLIDYVRVYAL